MAFKVTAQLSQCIKWVAQCAYALCADSCYSSPAAGCQANCFLLFVFAHFSYASCFFLFWMLLHLLLLLNFNTSSHTLNSATVKAKIVVYFLFSVSVFKYFRCRGRAGAKLAEPSEKRWSRQCEAEGRVACLVALTGSIINQLLWARKLAKWKLNTQMCGACDCEWIRIWIRIWIASSSC